MGIASQVVAPRVEAILHLLRNPLLSLSLPLLQWQHNEGRRPSLGLRITFFTKAVSAIWLKYKKQNNLLLFFFYKSFGVHFIVYGWWYGYLPMYTYVYVYIRNNIYTHIHIHTFMYDCVCVYTHTFVSELKHLVFQEQFMFWYQKVKYLFGSNLFGPFFWGGYFYYYQQR